MGNTTAKEFADKAREALGVFFRLASFLLMIAALFLFYRVPNTVRFFSNVEVDVLKVDSSGYRVQRRGVGDLQLFGATEKSKLRHKLFCDRKCQREIKPFIKRPNLLLNHITTSDNIKIPVWRNPESRRVALRLNDRESSRKREIWKLMLPGLLFMLPSVAFLFRFLVRRYKSKR